MAVFNPGTPNLAGNYANIEEALNKRADIAGKDSGTMGAVAAVAAPIAEEAQTLHSYDLKKGLEAFKGSIEDQINKNQSQYQAQAAGKQHRTQDDISNLVKKSYGDISEKYIPQVGSEGIWATPQEIQALADHGEYSAQTEKFAAGFDKTDPEKANLIRVLSKDKNNTQYLALLGGSGKITYQVDNNTGYHVPVNQMGQVVGPPLETQGATVDPKGSVKVTDYTTLPPKMRMAVEKEKTKAEADPQINKNVDKLGLLDQLRDAVIKNNPTEITNIRAQLGQSIGGLSGSRMSSTMLQSEGFSKALADQFEQWGTTKLSGNLSETNQKMIISQIDDTKNSVKKQLRTTIGAKAKDLVAASGGRLDEAAANNLVSSKAVAYLQPDIILQDAHGQTFRLRNPEKLQQYLQQGYKRVQ